MKLTLRFFAILDVICLSLLAQQANDQFQSFSANETLTSLEFFLRLLFLLGWLSLIVSAILLAIPRKAGIILYYVQLPVRVMFFMFSFGFISILSYWIDLSNLNQIIVSIAIFGELLRIYYTWQIHRDYFYKKAL